MQGRLDGLVTIRLMAEFLIEVHTSEHGYDVSCPTLQGCHSQGATEQEAIENIRDAIQEYLGALRDLKGDRKLVKIDVAV